MKKTFRKLTALLLALTLFLICFGCSSNSDKSDEEITDSRKEVSSDLNIVGGNIIAAGCYHTAALKSDGSAIAVGNAEYNQCEVSGWTDIISVAAGNAHTVGLKSDGTVVTVGYNEYGECDLSNWSDIKLPE